MRENTHEHNEQKRFTSRSFVRVINEHFCSKEEKQIEFNDEINSVMLRILHSEAMNGGSISTEEALVCVCVSTGGYLAASRCQTGSQPCLWRDPLRYDYRLPRPHSPGQLK